MKSIPVPDRGYMEFGRWYGAPLGMNYGCFLGNIIRNSRHWMYGVEVLCMLRGSHTVWVDGVEHRMEAGDILTIDSFQSHEIYDGEPGGLQIIFNFDETLLRRSGNVRLALSTVGEHALPKDHPDVSTFREYALALAELTGGGYRVWRGNGPVSDADWFEARKLFYGILACMSRHQVPAEGTKPENPMLLANCIREIHNHYAEPLSIGSLAEQFGYSESSLYRLFRQNLGVSFLDYLTSVRLNIACGMLMKNEHTVQEVSDLCGFSTYGNFYRIFKNRMGISPSAYQENAVVTDSVPWTSDDYNPLYQHNVFERFPVLPEDDWASVRAIVQNW